MLTWEEILLRLAVASVLGGLVGIERQRYDWAAGLRTHMLVCLGSALMMIVSSFGFMDVLSLGHSNISLDVSRVAAQVVSGIGFLGAGTIMFLKREEVKGLTTAAGLWAVAGVGLAIGGGLYFAGGVTTALILIILVLIKPAKKKISAFYHPREVHLLVNRSARSIRQIEALASENHLKFDQVAILHTDKDDNDLLQLRFEKHVSTDALLGFMDSLKQLQGINEVKLRMD